MSTSEYAICTKIEGQIKYLNRIATKEYNTSKLDKPFYVYSFGDLGDDTLIADKENWATWLNPSRFNEITEFMTHYEFVNFRMAFVKVEKKYETSICTPFYLNVKDGLDGDVVFTADINWNSFC